MLSETSQGILGHIGVDDLDMVSAVRCVVCGAWKQRGSLCPGCLEKQQQAAQQLEQKLRWDSCPGTKTIDLRDLDPNTRAGTKALPVVKRESLARALEDVVNHPSHYISESGLEVIDVCRAFGLIKDAYLFNVVKYILRNGRKNIVPGQQLEDLKKAHKYLDWKIEELEKEEKPCPLPSLQSR
jgi:hypothetical protein